MPHVLVNLDSSQSDELVLLDDLKQESEGSFRELFERALDGIAEAGGGTLTVHRGLPVEHTNTQACPCRPLVLSGVTPRDPDDILEEIERTNG